MCALTCCRALAIGVSLVLTLLVDPVSAQQAASDAVAIDGDDIGGIVRSPSGPEAGVWVIAETTDLPTKFAKIVVTDEQGRYVIPDLPKAKYKVWVRGYGLVDSPMKNRNCIGCHQLGQLSTRTIPPAESSYYTWVDQHNTFGLGENIPMLSPPPSRRSAQSHRWPRSRCRARSARANASVSR
jgi:hypothetical protein